MQLALGEVGAVGQVQKAITMEHLRLMLKDREGEAGLQPAKAAAFIDRGASGFVFAVGEMSWLSVCSHRSASAVYCWWPFITAAAVAMFAGRCVGSDRIAMPPHILV
jgi:hypothetical protein